MRSFFFFLNFAFIFGDLSNPLGYINCVKTTFCSLGATQTVENGEWGYRFDFV